MAVVAAATHDELVLVLLDRRQGRASVFVNGKRKASVPAAIPAAVHVSVGSSSSSALPSPVSDPPSGQVASDTPTAFAATKSP
jgi:hypothetical protein